MGSIPRDADSVGLGRSFLPSVNLYFYDYPVMLTQAVIDSPGQRKPELNQTLFDAVNSLCNIPSEGLSSCLGSS